MINFKRRSAALLTIGLIVSSTQNTEASQPKAIIFDLHKVISKTDNWSFIDKMGISTILTYVVEKRVLPWKLGPIIQERLFAMLDQCDFVLDAGLLRSQSPTGELSPTLLTGYQAGKISAEDARALIQRTMNRLRAEQFFSSETEATLIERAALVTFSPETFAQGQVIIPESAALLAELAALTDQQGQKMYKLIALSNWDKNSFPLFKSRFEKVFSCFDAIYISGEIGLFKPNDSAFDYVLKNHGLAAKDCCFLDDQPDNIETALRIGIRSHHFTDAKNARIFLRSLGIPVAEAPAKREGPMIPIAIAAACTACTIGVILAYSY